MKQSLEHWVVYRLLESYYRVGSRWNSKNVAGRLHRFLVDHPPS